MKNLNFPLRIVILFIVLLASQQTFGQVSPLSNPLQHVNEQMRNIFTPLSKPPSNLNYLYEMSGHLTEDKFWTNVSYDMSSTENWYKLYWEQFYMAYDTSALLHDMEIHENALQFRSDTIPLGVLDVSYYTLVSNALTSNNYFDFDTVNDIITDIAGRVGYPYNEENIFTFAPLFDKGKYSKITWVISPSFIFNDFANANFYNPSLYSFQVDFGDGNGFKTFDPTTIHYVTIDYGALGLSNEITLNAQILEDGVLRKHSRSKFLLGKKGTPPRPYDELVFYNDLPVYIYRACGSSPLNRKIVVYLEGIDLLDFIPKFNRDACDIYHEMLQQPNISQLSNYGYDFYIVDWQNSRIDMRSNAMSIVALLDALKAEVQNDHEFIIIGESMGGIIARFALSFMESPLYTDPINFPNANRRERMHNCRLMITWDSPHQGANLPLSIQHMYDAVLKLPGKMIFGIPISMRFIFAHFNLFLDAMATKQLLINHIDTKSPFGLYKTYTEHPERTQFLMDLASLGNYPQFCKKMAVSNGALNGEMQTKFSSPTSRVANDKLLDFSTALYAKILWFFKVPIMGADLELRTNPAGQGKIFQFNAGTWGIKLKFYLFGVKLITGYNSLFNFSEYADVNAHCVNSGGYLYFNGLEKVIGNSTASGTHWNLSRYSLLNLASFRSGSDGNGCWSTQAHVGYDGIASINFDLSICSDGMQFGFIPLQSALDFGVLNSVPLDHNFEADLIANPAIMNTSTPFDVIVAISGADAGYPLGLGLFKLNRGHLYVKYEGEDQFLEQSFPFRDCISIPANGNGIFGHWVNREIGDEIFYLDNLICNRNAIYEAEHRLYVNAFNNPWYKYANGTGVGKPGFFSKVNPFIIADNVNADFRYDQVLPIPTPPNFYFSPAPNQGFPPFTGSWTENMSSRIACPGCFDFGKKAIESTKLNNRTLSSSSFSFYPNPNEGVIYLNYSFVNSDNLILQITDLYGRIIYTRSLNKVDNANSVSTIINLKEENLKSGFYFISLSNGKEVLSKKLVIK